MGKKMKKVVNQESGSPLAFSHPREEISEPDFLPLGEILVPSKDKKTEGGSGRKLPKQGEPLEVESTVLYIGRIPHGFYEEEMEGFFKQFGTVKRLKLARNKKTGKSKHYGFIEFESPEVAKIVADCMHNYLLFEHMLQVHLVPPDRAHAKLWKRARIKPLNWTEIERKRHNKVRTAEEQRRLVEGILKREQKRRKRIEAVGIDYEYPDIMDSIQPAPKKIRFEEEE